MKIKWLGHASFLITSDSGVRIITDPYAPTPGRLNYSEINESADVVTYSHEHGDHNNWKAVKGNPEVIKGPGVKEARGIQFKGIATAHDNVGGADKGPNTIFCFTVDGIRVCHLGDLGHGLSPEQTREVGQVDISLTPMAGFYTMDADTAKKVIDKIKPRVVIPMHFKNEKCLFPIAGLEECVKGMPNVKRLNKSEAEYQKNALPNPMETDVLTPSH